MTIECNSILPETQAFVDNFDDPKSMKRNYVRLNRAWGGANGGVHPDSGLTTPLSVSNLYLVLGSDRQYIGKVSTTGVISEYQICQEDGLEPSKPTNVVASIQPGDDVTVTWTASSDNVGVTGYKVYRNGILVESIGNTTTWYRSNECGGFHTYTIRAFDAVGNESFDSDPSNMIQSTNIDQCP